MNYDLNEEQMMLKESARKLLTKECDGMFVREMIQSEKGYTEEFWKKMAELGWMGLLIPEEYGGFDGSFLDLAVLLYEMGYCCLPGPFFSTAVLGTMALLEAATDEQKKILLPGVVEGDRLIRSGERWGWRGEEATRFVFDWPEEASPVLYVWDEGCGRGAGASGSPAEDRV